MGVMAIKRYYTFPKASALLEPHHQIVSCHIQEIHLQSLNPLQRCSLRILQHQLTGPKIIKKKLLLLSSYIAGFSECSSSGKNQLIYDNVMLNQEKTDALLFKLGHMLRYKLRLVYMKSLFFFFLDI